MTVADVARSLDTALGSRSTEEDRFGGSDPLRVLSLDGGGAKGFYTLGVLRQVEAMVGRPLHEHFGLIYGTSTGAIIAALLSLGRSVDEIMDLYTRHVPTIMRRKWPSEKSEALAELAENVFGDLGFADVRTGLGLVATKWMIETPMIFKADAKQAFGRSATFVPGFGVRMGDAVQASCSAYPFFKRKTVTTSAGEVVELMDGGYCANNPILYAIADATGALGRALGDVRVLSLGVGSYPEPKRSIAARMLNRLVSVQLLQKTLEINTQSMDQLRRILFKHVPTVRVSQSFSRPEMATDMFEHDLAKLNLLTQRGAESFGMQEADLRALLL